MIKCGLDDLLAFPQYPYVTPDVTYTSLNSCFLFSFPFLLRWEPSLKPRLLMDNSWKELSLNSLMPVFIPLVNMSESFLVISVFCTKRVNFHHALNQNKFLITFVFTFLFQVFDDGDERTLRRTSLCLKGERHFNESEVCD